MSPARRPLTVEEGRAMVARARAYKVLERVALVVAGIAIPLFAVSYLELRAIDVAVLAGGEMRIPVLAYTSIFLFVAGTALVFLMRHLIANISRALAAEQRRRWMEGDAPMGETPDAGGDVPVPMTGEMDIDDPPAVAG